MSAIVISEGRVRRVWGAIALRISSMVYGAGLREVVTRETVSIISAWRINNGQGGRLIRSPHGHSKPSRNEAAPGAVRAEKTGGVRKKDLRRI